MSRSLNKVILIGNLGADPEVRSTSNGSRVATLSLATSRQWKNQSGEKQEKTEWHRVILWNNKGSGLADIAEKYCKKGDKVYVEGSIEYRSWQDREGQTRYTTEIYTLSLHDALPILTRCHSVFSCFSPDWFFHWRLVASERVATREPLEIGRAHV